MLVPGACWYLGYGGACGMAVQLPASDHKCTLGVYIHEGGLLSSPSTQCLSLISLTSLTSCISVDPLVPSRWTRSSRLPSLTLQPNVNGSPSRDVLHPHADGSDGYLGMKRRALFRVRDYDVRVSMGVWVVGVYYNGS